MPLYDTRRPKGERPKPAAADIEVDRYLTDGKRLYRISEKEADVARLENCRCPGEMGMWQPLSFLLSGTYRVVFPARKGG